MSLDPEKPYNDLPDLPPAAQLETTPVLKACIEARAALALQQAARLIPNPAVLINTMPLLEAQASSEIENIVTTRCADPATPSWMNVPRIRQPVKRSGIGPH